MNNKPNNANQLLAEWDDFEQQLNTTDSWVDLKELEQQLEQYTTTTNNIKQNSPGKSNAKQKDPELIKQIDFLKNELQQTNSTINDAARKQNNMLANQALIKQIDVLKSELQQAHNIIKKERAEKQNTVKLLKEKLHEIQSLRFKLNKMNENIKCCQEHIVIEQNNYKTAGNKLAHLAGKLQTAEKIIKQKDKIIHNIKAEHEESMRRAQIIIEEFYKDKFFDTNIQQNIKTLSNAKLAESYML